MNSAVFYNISPQKDFLATLARYLLARYSDNPLTLAKTLILLPTRRSCRQLHEAFFHISNGKPMLLPRINPIGDLDFDEFNLNDYNLSESDLSEFTSSEFNSSESADCDNIQSNNIACGIMPQMRRLGLLMQLIIRSRPMSSARAYLLAVELARLLDEVYISGLDFSNLDNLAPLELAEHWRQTTDFLRIITHSWPHILQEMNKCDAAFAMRVKTLRLIECWKKNPPPFPVIAAGSTGSIPTTASLLGVIAAMKQGMVILPGLDKNMSEAAWEAIDNTHPQSAIKLLLENSAVHYQDVRELDDQQLDDQHICESDDKQFRAEKLPETQLQDTQAVDKQAIDKQAIDKQTVDKQTVDKQTVDKQTIDKQTIDKQAGDKQLQGFQLDSGQLDSEQSDSSLAEFLSILFMPAPLTAQWREKIENFEAARDLKNIRLLQADTQNEEARMIAFHLRKILETPGKTAAFVTPDRNLAAMVAAECKAYGLNIDDSAGTNLSRTPCGVFMRLICEVSASGAVPQTLLALLQHPFATLGGKVENRQPYRNWLEYNILRGVRLKQGTDSLLEQIILKSPPDNLVTAFKNLQAAIRPLEMLYLRDSPVALAEIIKLHCQAAESIADNDNNSGSDIIWRGEHGEAMAEFFAKWRDDADYFGEIKPHDYSSLFTTALAAEVSRPRYGTHPRLHILSPMEARLLHYDMVIIGDMNEGTLPGLTNPDPWMSIQMRKSFGLADAELNIGRSAHDLWRIMHGKEVILTRARKAAGVPQKPSRWWIRLANILSGKDPELLERIDISEATQKIIKERDKVNYSQTLKRPEPSPPLQARAKSFSVSDLDLWHKDPYAFYAKKILKLRPLPPVDQDPDSAEFGKLIHKTMEIFSSLYPDNLPENALQLLISCGQNVFQPYLSQPAVVNMWYPRFEAIAGSWLKREYFMRRENYHTESECAAKWQFTLANQEISISARADRVDIIGSNISNSFRLIDYKTGFVPAHSKIEQGEAKQLPLTALVLIESQLLARNFPDSNFPLTASSIAYWALKPCLTDDDSGEFSKSKDANYIEIEHPENIINREKEELLEKIARSLSDKDFFYSAPYSAKISEEYDDYAHLSRRKEWNGQS